MSPKIKKKFFLGWFYQSKKESLQYQNRVIQCFVAILQCLALVVYYSISSQPKLSLYHIFFSFKLFIFVQWKYHLDLLSAVTNEHDSHTFDAKKILKIAEPKHTNWLFRVDVDWAPNSFWKNFTLHWNTNVGSKIVCKPLHRKI